MRRLALLAALVACKGKSKEPPAPVAPVDAAPAKRTAALEFAPEADVSSAAKDAFGGRVPVLPAISGDGKTIARWSVSGGEPLDPQPFGVMFAPVGGDGAPVTVDVLDTATAPDAPPDRAKLTARAAEIVVRLADGKYASLREIEIPAAAGGGQAPAELGELELTPGEDDVDTDEPRLVVTLANAKTGVAVRRLRLSPYTGGSFDDGLGGHPACLYRPWLAKAYADAAKQRVFLEVAYRFHEMCSPSVPAYFAWNLAEPVPPAVLAETAVDREQLTDDALSVEPFGLGKPRSHVGGPHKTVGVTLSRDRKTAWSSASREEGWRSSELAVETPAGWRVAATAWSQPVENAVANARAKTGGSPGPGPYDEPAGDDSLRAAFAALTTNGVDAEAAANAELVAIGSGPGERTVGGAIFARGWNAAWKGKTAIASSVARLAPSGTTGWVAARVSLAKPGYQVPFTVFAIFDKTVAGAWTLVHIHFAV